MPALENLSIIIAICTPEEALKANKQRKNKGRKEKGETGESLNYHCDAHA